MGKESHDQAVAVADPPDAVAGLIGNLGHGVTGEVGQLGAFQVAQRYSTGLSSGA
jgi:hypothetical protein